MLSLKSRVGGITFNFFCLCDSDLDPMTFTCEFHPYTLKIYWMSKNKLFLLSIVTVRWTDTTNIPQLLHAW